MKSYEYRYQVRPYKLISCKECGHSCLDYGEPIWEEPIGRNWPESLRLRSASEHAESSKIGPADEGNAVGRFYDQEFHPDYHLNRRWLEMKVGVA